MVKMESIGATVLQSICSHNFPDESLSPQTFVNVVFKILQQPEVCLYQSVNHRQSTFCNERLYVLSAVVSCLEWSSGAKPVSQIHTLQHEQRKFSQENAASDGNGTQTKKQGSEDNTSASNWFMQSSQLLVTDIIITELLSLQERTHCLFSLHLVKKIIFLCAMRHQRIPEVLNHIAGKWSKNKNLCANELELVKVLISKKQNSENDKVRKQVCDWFVSVVSNSISSSIVKKLKEPGDESLEEKLLVLSILGKILKSMALTSMEIPNCISFVAFSVFEAYEEILFSPCDHKDENGHLVCVYYFKLLNNFVHVKYFFEKGKITEAVLQICSRISQNVTSLYKKCEAKNYLTTMTLWERKDPSTVRGQFHNADPASVEQNFVAVREIFFLMVKACAALTKGDHSMKDCSIHSLFSVWQYTDALMKRHVQHKHVSPALIKFLFGDQDDKWVAVLFCLLLIYQNLRGETKGSNLSTEKEVNECYSASVQKSDLTDQQDSLLKLIHPHSLFVQFSEFIYFDHLVISDFLMSPETYFIEYFTQYLLHLKDNWDSFVALFRNHDTSFRDTCQSSLYSNIFKTDEKQARCFHNSDQSQSETLKCYENVKRTSSNSCDLKMTNTIKLPRLEKQFGPLVPYVDSDCSDSSSSSSHYGTDHVLEKELEAKNTFFHFENNDNDNMPSSFDGETKLCENGVSVSKSSPLLSNPDCEISLNTNAIERSNFESIGETEQNKFDNIMTMLIRLRFHIERLHRNQLVPYKPEVLIELLSTCEEKYENLL